MTHLQNFQNALFLLFLFLGVTTYYAAEANKFPSHPIGQTQHRGDIKSESCQRIREKREVSFTTAQRVDTLNNRDMRQGRVPTRVRTGIPKVTVTQREILGIIGTNITLECFIESFPKATNFWMRGELERLHPKDNIGKYVITEDNFRHVQFSDRFRLQILNVSEDDLRNKFRCVASNEYGTDTGLIEVSAPSYLETKQFPSNGLVETRLGTRVILECEVKGYPMPVTYWFRKNTGEQLMWSEDYHVTEQKVNSLHYVSQLHIRSIAKTDFTTFICVSKNSLRVSQNVFRLLEKRSSWYQMSPSSADSPWNVANHRYYLLVIVFLVLFH